MNSTEFCIKWFIDTTKLPSERMGIKAEDRVELLKKIDEQAMIRFKHYERWRECPELLEIKEVEAIMMPAFDAPYLGHFILGLGAFSMGFGIPVALNCQSVFQLLVCPLIGASFFSYYAERSIEKGVLGKYLIELEKNSLRARYINALHQILECEKKALNLDISLSCIKLGELHRSGVKEQKEVDQYKLICDFSKKLLDGYKSPLFKRQVFEKFYKKVKTI